MNKQQIQQKILKWQQTNPNSGYTILEGLMAMLLVATTMSAIAPVVALSVGRRVQARRVELATQAARSYIDAVRQGDIEPPKIALTDPEGWSTVQGVKAPGELKCKDTDIQKPNPKKYCEATVNHLSVDSPLYCVDGGDGGDCKGLTDMIVYAVGFHGGNNKPEYGYELFVWVYRGGGVEGSELLNETISTYSNNAGLATRYGDKERALFKTTTEIAPKELYGSFKNICDRVKDKHSEKHCGTE